MLPQELCDIILDLLRDDPASLSSLSAASRVFTQRARKILFKRVVVRGPHRPTILPDFGGSASSFERFVRSSPKLARLIECLVVFDERRPEPDHDLPTDFDSETEESDFCPQNWITRDVHIARALSVFKKHATNLKALIFQIRSRADLKASTTQAMLDLMCSPTIEYLNVSGSAVPLAQFGLGPNLKHLAMSWRGNLSGLEIFRFSLQSPQKPVVLESLSLDCGNHSESILHWLTEERSAWVDISHLKKLDLAPSPHNRHVDARLLLHDCRLTLEELAFSPSSDALYANHAPLYTDFHENIDLSSLAQLRKLYIRIHRTVGPSGAENDNDNDRIYVDFFPWMLSFLRNRRSTNPLLEEIIIQVDYAFDVVAIDIGPWDEVIDILTDGTFPALTKLRIHFSSGQSDEEQAEIASLYNTMPCFDQLKKKDGFELILCQGERPGQDINPFRPNPDWMEEDVGYED